jgi:CDP-diacylglycerol--serine O-phosphatidyltransferase
MVSRFRYYSFKSWPRSDKVPFFWLILFVLILVALAMNPPRVLFGIAVIYALSGPVVTVWGRTRARNRHDPRPPESPSP